MGEVRLRRWRGPKRRHRQQPQSRTLCAHARSYACQGDSRTLPGWRPSSGCRSARGSTDKPPPSLAPRPRLRRRGLGVTQLVRQFLHSQRHRDTLGVVDRSALIGGDREARHSHKRRRNRRGYARDRRHSADRSHGAIGATLRQLFAEHVSSDPGPDGSASLRRELERDHRPPLMRQSRTLPERESSPAGLSDGSERVPSATMPL